MISRFITLVAICALPVITKAQCAASFTYSVNGQTVTFTGMTNPPATPNTSFYWWFSDGNNSSNLQNPVYTFSAPGTYIVCFSYYDFVTQCSDSICQPVTVGGGCTADFTWIDTSGYVYFMSSTTAGAGAMYYWDFGDGNYSSQSNPAHQYANAGVYNVCLTVYDSMQNFCDSTCHTVVVQGSGGCNADFTSVDSMGYVFFLSSTTAAGAMYYWDFGDGNYSNAQNPSHVYANPGFYTVCLTVYDSMQVFCDSTCHTVQATAVSVEENTLLQTSLTASPNPADGVVALSYMTTGAGNATIKFYDATGRISMQEVVAVHGAGSNKTEINTNTMAQGIYLVKIEVDGAEAWTRIAVTHQSRP